MRFFLDQNIDARLRGHLNNAGHEAWTADDAGLAEDVDPNLSIYADDQGAVLITHDREFSASVRKRNVAGRHVWLRCPPLAGPGLFMQCLPDIEPILERYDVLFIEVKPTKFVVTHGSEWR